MEPVLSKGQIAGKLVCPNEKCGVKIGNFDWAGVQCGCKEWVTPVSFYNDMMMIREVTQKLTLRCRDFVSTEARWMRFSNVPVRGSKGLGTSCLHCM